MIRCVIWPLNSKSTHLVYGGTGYQAFNTFVLKFILKIAVG